jgi:hypothetical protein
MSGTRKAYLIWCVLPLATAGVLAQSGPQRLSQATPIASPQASERSANPLLTPSPLPFQAPPFDKIKDSDFAPAFDEGMKQQMAEVEKISNNPGASTFNNTLVALERSGQTLARISLVFNALSAIAPSLRTYPDFTPSHASWGRCSWLRTHSVISGRPPYVAQTKGACAHLSDTLLENHPPAVKEVLNE